MKVAIDLFSVSYDIDLMTRTFYISGQTSLLQNILRTLFVAAAAVGGLFVLAASAAFAFFIAAGLLIIGVLTFAFFKLRAKLFGRPFGPQVQFEKARAEMEAALGVAPSPAGSAKKNAAKTDGPIIDAHQTPHGWSVDD